MLQEQQVIFYAIIVGIVALVIYLTSKGSRQSVMESLSDTIIGVLTSEETLTPDTRVQVELINSMSYVNSLNITPLDIENSNEEQALEFIEKHKKQIKMFNILRSIEDSFIMNVMINPTSDIQRILTPVYDECTDSERDVIDILLKQHGFEFDGKILRPIEMKESKSSKVIKKLINTPISLDLSRGSGEKTKPKKTTKPKVSKPKKETPKKTTLLEPIVKRKKKNK